MNVLYHNIKSRREELGISQEELAYRLGYKSRSSINKIELGLNDLPQSKIKAFAQALNTTPAQLMGWDQEPSSKEKSVFDYPGIMPLPKTYKLPLIGDIACGTPILAVENIEGYINTPENVHADYCLRCNGDSMINARIMDGDIVFIKEQPIVDDGEIAAVLIDGEATLKRVYYDKEAEIVTLTAENPTFKALRYQGEQLEAIRILGKAVYFASIVR